MKTTSLSRHIYQNLDKFVLPNNVFNTEAKIFLIPHKDGWTNNRKLLKEFYIQNGSYFGQKLLTVNALIDNKEKINSYIEELVLPDSLAIYKDQIIGITMDYIPSTGLNQALRNLSIPIEQRLQYLKEVGEIIAKTEQLRKYSEFNGFCLNDVHEDNFIIDSNNKVMVVDTDSCKIQGNYPPVAKLLTSRSLGLNNLPNKYVPVEDVYGTTYVPSKETDLYCYIMMILNFLYSERVVDKLPEEEYYSYLDYLNDLNISKEMINVFETVFTSKPNTNPYEIIDCLKDVYPRSIKNVYRKVYKKD